MNLFLTFFAKLLPVSTNFDERGFNVSKKEYFCANKN